MQKPATQQVSALLRSGIDALQKGRPEEAGQFCRQALSIDPKEPRAHFLVGLVAQDLNDLKTAAQAFGSVTKLDPAHAAAWAHLARLFMRMGQPARAESAVSKAIGLNPSEPPVADLIGVVLSLLGDQRRARGWHQKAHDAAPSNEPYLVNLATTQMFLGENDEAQRLLAPIIDRENAPAQAEWLFSSIVRAKNADRAEKLMLRAAKTADVSAAFLAYAAGKEFEDCGLWERAFDAFEAGAAAKRATIDFDEAAEEARFKALADVFSDRGAIDESKGCVDPSPVFVVGQPRTGTTLIERIITSHSQVESAGELQQFRLSVSRLAHPGGDKPGDVETVKRWAAVDPKALGEEYLRVSAPMRSGAPRFVDKLPGNYQNIPLILAALPNARVIHVNRDPMDACFASYKQLFAEAYLHSYDQEEMARHYARYWRLMEIWRRLYPGRFLDIAYEDTVKDLETNARRLIGFLGLPWEDRCLRYYEQEGAVATASAVQVRERPHARSIGRWRRYEARLAPLRGALIRQGIPVFSSGS
ncbi:MAG TPA: sulfotransferase [Parvularculaceae bacterium]|nr:sulfotransferase [Parvularculaceae bacterium]